ncbi:MAG: hypothetical protein RDV41_04415 [Planctomycetota bacterium]|nr:hypothetical protein [Planctomycetota bacterium]
MIKVQHIDPDDFTISDGADTIVLSRVDYEDMFFAVPLDSPALYLLLNQTILQTAKSRDTLKRIIDRHGGIDAAMQALQVVVQALDPKAPVTPTKAAATAPSAPPLAAALPVAPVAALAPIRAASAKGQIPTAEVVAPPPKPAKTTAAPTPIPPEKKKPSVMHEKTVVAHVVSIPEKAKAVKVAKGADGSYTINFGSQNVVLSNAKFKELYFALPMDIPSVFKLFFTSLLPDVKSKSAFRRMMSMAGGSSVFLGLVVKELEKMRAQDV